MILVWLHFQNSRLYYENTTGTYYYYDEESASYKFHSQVDLSGTQKKSADKENTDDVESGEEISDDEEGSVKDTEGTQNSFQCTQPLRRFKISVFVVDFMERFLAFYSAHFSFTNATHFACPVKARICTKVMTIICSLIIALLPTKWQRCVTMEEGLLKKN